MFRTIAREVAKGLKLAERDEEIQEDRESIATDTRERLRSARSGLELKTSITEKDRALAWLSKVPVVKSVLKSMRIDRSIENINGVDVVEQQATNSHNARLKSETARLRRENKNLPSDVASEQSIQEEARAIVDQSPESRMQQEGAELEEGVKAFTEEERAIRDTKITNANKSLETALAEIEKNTSITAGDKATQISDAKSNNQNVIARANKQYASLVKQFDTKQMQISTEVLDSGESREDLIEEKSNQVQRLENSIIRLNQEIKAYNELKQKIAEAEDTQAKAEKYTKTLNGLIDKANKLSDDTSADMMEIFARGMNIPNPENITSKGELVDLLRKELSGNESEILSVVDNLTSLNTKLDKIQINELNSDLKTDTGTKNTLEKQIKDLTLPKSTPNTPTAQQVK